MQLSLFVAEDNIKANSIQNKRLPLEAVFEAYHRCRRSKRSTNKAIAFELDFENQLIQLWKELNEGTYQPSGATCFMIHKPVQREIFAAAFRDRVVHHLVIYELEPYLNRKFIRDSYACRLGKGTHYGIRRVNQFIRKCSVNYTQDAYILKLDIEGFFMHIHREILFKRLEKFMAQDYQGNHKKLMLEICHKIICNTPTQNCTIQGHTSNWKGLPKSKSLFWSPPNCGLPIGNLTSQVFANLYMNDFDHFIKKTRGIRYYGRYVDDFVIVHHSKSYLKQLVPILSEYLLRELKLTLHPKKKYLQHYAKGVQFLGTFIKPSRTYIGNRTKGNFYKAMQEYNQIVTLRPPTKEEKQAFLSRMNAYLGLMKHYKTYKLRKKMLLQYLNSYWWNHVYLSKNMSKFVLKTRKAGKKNAHLPLLSVKKVEGVLTLQLVKIKSNLPHKAQVSVNYSTR